MTPLVADSHRHPQVPVANKKVNTTPEDKNEVIVVVGVG